MRLSRDSGPSFPLPAHGLFSLSLPLLHWPPGSDRRRWVLRCHPSNLPPPDWKTTSKKWLMMFSSKVKGIENVANTGKEKEK